MNIINRRTFTILAAFAFVVTATIFLLSAKARGQNSDQSVTVTISNLKFTPKEVTIKAGATVNWEDKEGTHTVKADDGSWESPTLSKGKTYSRTFDKPGKYGYYCTFHGSPHQDMAGTVIVKK